MFIVQVVFNGITAGATIALMSIGLTLIFSILGIVNFVHGIMFALGALVAHFATQSVGLDYLSAVVAAALLVGLFGLLLERFGFRRFENLVLEGAVFAIALALFLEAAMWAILGGSPRSVETPFSGVFRLGDLIINKHRLFVVVVAFTLIGALSFFIRYSRYGRAIRAVQQDPYAARLQGIEPHTISMLVFAAGAALAGIAGALIVPMQLALPDMGTAPLLLAFVAIILGGVGSVGGALAAAMVLGMLQSVITTFWSPQITLGIVFAATILILLVLPEGLFGRKS
ncbi:MAG: branched-chain amino acid ABC transporter permease [Rhizobiaceae bacterium]|nr:branched-chain amino acid ABC transporter permease [Rhizobiaceae bacterium]